MPSIRIQINGEEREVAAGSSISDLLRTLGLDRQACAVEVNLTLVPKARHGAHILADGDRLEVVSLVGGG
jgi:thiamine biosynthesis protein ThiS